MEILAWIVWGIILLVGVSILIGLFMVGYDSQKAITKAAKDDDDK